MSRGTIAAFGDVPYPLHGDSPLPSPTEPRFPAAAPSLLHAVLPSAVAWPAPLSLLLHLADGALSASHLPTAYLPFPTLVRLGEVCCLKVRRRCCARCGSNANLLPYSLARRLLCTCVDPLLDLLCLALFGLLCLTNGIETSSLASTYGGTELIRFFLVVRSNSL